MSLDEQIQAVQEKGMILAQNELSEIQFKKLVNLLYRNLDLFATGMRDLVGTDVMYHSIELERRNRCGRGPIVKARK